MVTVFGTRDQGLQHVNWWVLWEGDHNLTYSSSNWFRNGHMAQFRPMVYERMSAGGGVGVSGETLISPMGEHRERCSLLPLKTVMLECDTQACWSRQ